MVRVSLLNFLVQYIRKKAAESTERYNNNVPRSVLDGVPVSIKDQIGSWPYLTSKGSTHMLPSTSVRGTTHVAMSCAPYVVNRLLIFFFRTTSSSLPTVHCASHSRMKR